MHYNLQQHAELHSITFLHKQLLKFGSLQNATTTELEFFSFNAVTARVLFENNLAAIFFKLEGKIKNNLVISFTCNPLIQTVNPISIHVKHEIKHQNCPAL
jgi:hypothetical protein